jgi:type IV pilus assembly protein PilW
MTLIELMVALVIGLGVTLAVTTLLIAGENHKRTTTSTNDAEQTGAYVFNALDGMLRGAGSAIAESAYLSPDAGVFGCKLNAGTGGGKFLPRTGAFPPPFGANFLGGAPSNLRVAPLLIAQNQSPDGKSDVLVVMGGSGAAGGVSRQVTVAGNATTVTLDNAVGFVTNDLFLVSQNGTADCLLEQVNTVTAPTLNLLNTLPYYTVGTTTTLATLAGSTASYVTPLGNAGANNLQFNLIGVDANHTLYTYDLLQNLSLVQSPGTADAAQAIADGVYQMHAIFGIDNNGDGIQDTWAAPTVAAGYDINTVMTTPATIRKIIAVRVALVLRGEYYDKNNGAPVSPATLTLFGGLTDSTGTALPALAQTINLTTTEQQFRYRVFEFTVPLRNMILLAGGP